MSIAAFLNSTRVQTKLKPIVDDTSAFLVDPNKEAFLQARGISIAKDIIDQYALLDEHVPVEMSDDFRVLEYRMRRNMAIASVIATGQEIPQTRIGTLARIEGEFGKLAISHIWNENDEIRMLELSRVPGIPTGFAEMLFKGVDALQPRIMKLANVLTWQVIYQKFCDYTDPRSNTRVRLEYQTEADQFPAPLTGAARWDRYDTATGLADIIQHASTFYNRKGYYPAKTVMSKQLRNHLMMQQSTRVQAQALGLIGTAGQQNMQTVVDQQVLDKLAERLDFPPIKIYDAQYEIEITPGNTQRGRYIPSHTYAFLSPMMGKRLFGPTIEGKGLPGIFIKIEETLKTSPPESRCYAVARFFPDLEPSLLGARKVL